MTVRVYVPGDSAALSVGADEVAAAILREAARRGLAVDLVRNGSRGLFWLEPMIEVEAAAGRVAYGPVAAGDVLSLFKDGFLEGGAHPLAQGPTEEIPYLKQQERLTFARCGITDPLSLRITKPMAAPPGSNRRWFWSRRRSSSR
jgi:formate dehydrogenase iron-sulfur subunit